MLYLLDYGAGNVRSLANSLTRLGYDFRWICDPDDFNRADSLIFPGVGAFHSAVTHLSERSLLDPLRQYIASGKPYFGICIGLQILFSSSAESPEVSGLAIIDAPVHRFSSKEKPVPHIGWNSVYHPPERPISSIYPTDPDTSYYFVHSYCAKYRPDGPASSWTLTTTPYGDETFISSIRKGNVFATQFHPEKSGESGLRLLQRWLSTSTAPDPPRSLSIASSLPRLSPANRPTRRIVACLDVRTNDQGDLVVTKGDQYDVREKSDSKSVRNLGKPVALASRYFHEGADELCLLNITSFRNSPMKDQPMLAVVAAAAETVFVPLTIGGGIKDTTDPDGSTHSALQVASTYFRAGADKVSIGSEAVFTVEKLLRGEEVQDNPITSIASVYGNQAVVISIDPLRAYVDPVEYNGPFKEDLIHGSGDQLGQAWWYQCTVFGGREKRLVSVQQLARGVEKLGAGELLINSIDRDGSGKGFDIDLIRAVRNTVSLPIIASSGAGAAAHFVDLFQAVDVEAALAAGIFHRNEVPIAEVKGMLQAAQIEIRSS